jgi:ABC-type nickel/cobalt efflux system permease component RcnA
VKDDGGLPARGAWRCLVCVRIRLESVCVHDQTHDTHTRARARTHTHTHTHTHRLPQTHTDAVTRAHTRARALNPSHAQRQPDLNVRVSMVTLASGGLCFSTWALSCV